MTNNIDFSEMDCKLFITDGTRTEPPTVHAVLDLAHAVIPGILESRSLQGDGIAIVADENDDRDPMQAEDPDRGFLFWPLFLEIYFSPATDRRARVEQVRTLVRHLRAHGQRVVAACDYEDELPSA